MFFIRGMATLSSTTTVLLDSDTIIAMATPVGHGAISVIRLSGGAVLPILRVAITEDDWEPKPRHAYLKTLKDEQGAIVDEVLVTYYENPASYTGEDTIELSGHGGVFVTQKVLQHLLDCGDNYGLRLAQAGEFTQRAYMNGKLDLTQAEAVMDVISAQSDLALQAAQKQLGGGFKLQIIQYQESLLEVLAQIEAYIDFPDEPLEPASLAKIAQKISHIKNAIAKALQFKDQSRYVREGVRTALIGAPNAGKSSLLNTLVGYERAIVSDIQGTTRDTIEESLRLDGILLRLIDTAGIRDSDDVIEKQGIERSHAVIEEADLILEVVDVSEAKPSGYPWFSADTNNRIVLYNKSDLPIHPDWEAELQSDVAPSKNAFLISCVQSNGIEELKSAIKSKLGLEDWLNQSELIATNKRQQEHLKETLKFLEQTLEAIDNTAEAEWISFEIRESLAHLGEIVGHVDTEDLLGKLFSAFCVGK